MERLEWDTNFPGPMIRFLGRREEQALRQFAWECLRKWPGRLNDPLALEALGILERLSRGETVEVSDLVPASAGAILVSRYTALAAAAENELARELATAAAVQSVFRVSGRSYRKGVDGRLSEALIDQEALLEQLYDQARLLRTLTDPFSEGNRRAS
jgi:hypothetical protein